MLRKLRALALRSLRVCLLTAAGTGGSVKVLAQDAIKPRLPTVAAWEIRYSADGVCQPYHGGVPAAAWVDRGWEAMGIPDNRILRVTFMTETCSAAEAIVGGRKTAGDRLW